MYSRNANHDFASCVSIFFLLRELCFKILNFGNPHNIFCCRIRAQSCAKNLRVLYNVSTFFIWKLQKVIAIQGCRKNKNRPTLKTKNSIKTDQKLFCFSDTSGQSQASFDKRWSRLLELKKTIVWFIADLRRF